MESGEDKVIRTFYVKRLIILTLLLFALVVQARPQGRELEFFVRPSLTSLYGNSVVEKNFDLTLHLSAGIATNFLFWKNSLVNVGLIYERKGGHGSSTYMGRDENNAPTKELRLNTVQDYDYLLMPIMYKLRFGEKLKIRVGGGFYAAYLLRCMRIDETELLRVKSESNDGTKFFDLGLSASVDVYLPLSKKLDAVFGLNEYFGLLNVSSVPVMGDQSIKHQSLGTVLGLKYAIK